jgi:hypothetical protein
MEELLKNSGFDSVGEFLKVLFHNPIAGDLILEVPSMLRSFLAFFQDGTISRCPTLSFSSTMWLLGSHSSVVEKRMY